MDHKKLYFTPSEWFKSHRQELKIYRNQWIAYSNTGIIAHHKEFDVMIKEVEKISKNRKNYVIAHIHEYDFSEPIRFLPVRFKMVKAHEWQPLYEVELKYKKSMSFKMLVDSGADFSLIPFQIGISLGYSLSDGEIIYKAAGIGGSVEYVLRNIEIKIDNYSLKAPIAWVQTKHCDDIILGREMIFDTFDIEFKQADEDIIFRKRRIKK